MKILAVDTASRTCSVAVLEDVHLLAETVLFKAQVHSRHLMDMIDGVLNHCGLGVSDMDGFAVSKGPGGFTGLRIGMSVMKGMALALGKPIAGVPTLHALVFPLRWRSERICALLDARRGDVYVGDYRTENGRVVAMGDPLAMTPEAAASRISEPCVFVGDGAEAYRNVIETLMGEQACFTGPEHNIVRAESIARIAIDRFQVGLDDDVAELAPVYVRKSDAELNLGRRTN